MALLRANFRYWPTVFPFVAVQLRRWEHYAAAIQEPVLRELALRKLTDERFNAEVAATLATLAPRRLRARTTEALVAYEVLYDFLDGLTEGPLEDPLAEGRRLYRPFVRGVIVGEPADDIDADNAGAYVTALSLTTQTALSGLPRANAVTHAARNAAQRCAEAQTRTHAATQLGGEQLQRWAERTAAGSDLGWRVFLAGSMASVLSIHALIGAAAREDTTATDADELDKAYLTICALSTMLDSLVDHDADRAEGRASFLDVYESIDAFERDFTHTGLLAVEQARRLRDGDHHLMMLVGVLAYYLSAPAASSEIAQLSTAEIRSRLDSTLAPTLRVMRAWRTAKRARWSTPLGPAARQRADAQGGQDGR